jgi:peptidyl-prolyl cis-trans isomerase C
MRLVSLFFILIFTLFGCDKLNFLTPQKVTKKESVSVPVVKGTVIAKVNNLAITLEELNRYVDIYNASLDFRGDLTAEDKKTAKIDTRDKKIDVLKNLLVRERVFYQAALDRGIARRDDIIELLERNKIAILAQEMQNEIVKNIDVSSAEIEDAYNKNKQLFREPETRKVREVVVKTGEEARQILIELLQGADFASTAKARSIGKSAASAGDLGYIKRGERGEQFTDFDEVAFSPALQAGAVSNVFKGPEGYYIVKIEEIKGGKQISLSEVWDTLKGLLLAGKQKDELDKHYSQLSRENKIEIYEGDIK